MNTILVKPFGYSASMEHILKVAQDTRQLHPDKRIVLLGNLLHADPVVKELNNMGVEIADVPYELVYKYVQRLAREVVVITSPYGTDKRIYKLCKQKRQVIVDGTSPETKKKVKFLKKRKFGKKVVYIGNPGTMELSYYAHETHHRYFLYDITHDTVDNKKILAKKKLNKAKTIVLYQAVLASDELTLAKRKVGRALDKSTFCHELSDEYYERNQYLDENLKDGDYVVIMTVSKQTTRYLLDYYHLSTKKVLYAICNSVEQCMCLDFDRNKRVFLISDGSVPLDTVKEINRYFYYL